MTRDELIAFIKEHDKTYDYEAVNFKFYSDEDLQRLKEKIDRETEEKANEENNNPK